MHYLSQAHDYIYHSYHVLKKWYRNVWWQYSLTLFYAFCKISPSKKNTTVSFDTISLTIPNNFISLLIIQEIFVQEHYRHLKWLSHVLDLWWYIWESGLYLSKYNKNVTIVESDPHNFTCLQNNLKNKSNITLIQKAVVADENQTFFLNEDNEYWWTISTHKSAKCYQIETITIEQLCKHTEFDWLKMDIEWGEYPILKYCMQYDLFPFKKWFIEFHFHTNEYKEEYSIIKQFFHFLWSRFYVYEMFDNAWRPTSIVHFLQTIEKPCINNWFINIYFEKYLW